jgi:hypothetical protein
VTKTRLDKESYYSASWYSTRVARSQESGIVVSKDEGEIFREGIKANIEEVIDEEIIKVLIE